MSPLLSVILPTFERAARLEGAMQSVLDQTERDLELLVIDDGSKDRTPQVVERAAEKDPRVHGIRKEASSGPSAARNAGIARAEGEFLAFIDDDDRWLPQKTAVQLEYLRTHPNVAAVFCRYERLDERKNRTWIFRTPTTYSKRALLWSNFAGSPSLGIVRRSLLNPDQRFDESLPPCEDWDYWIACAERGEVVTLPEVLCRIVFHGEAQSAFDRERQSRGVSRFLEKHAGTMSPACRAYHAARLELIQTPQEYKRFAIHLSHLARLPRGVRHIVAIEALSARIGRLTGDPALAQRTLLSMAERSDKKG
jgi:glycosyltransferase involved in cell wall biosynthesis